MLDTALERYEEDHLSTPLADSAYAWYHRVLSLDPENTEALRGIERIAERYVALALQAANAWRFDSADNLLRLAAGVQPGHPSIEPTSRQIALLRTARRETFRIPASQGRSNATQKRLNSIGASAKNGDCRVQIRATSDEEGRWIYQQLSEAPGDQRVRATMDIGAPAELQLVCFNACSSGTTAEGLATQGDCD